MTQGKAEIDIFRPVYTALIVYKRGEKTIRVFESVDTNLHKNIQN